jgi:hypothetical protein
LPPKAATGPQLGAVRLCYAVNIMASSSGKKSGIAAPSACPARSRSVPRIAKIGQRLGGMIPKSELKAIPKDLSRQIDHYVYGTPKK